MRFPKLPLIAFSLSLVAAAGCVKTSKTPPVSTAPSAPPKPQAPSFDLTKVTPNELGQIPVIMYHDIGRSGKNTPLDRTVASFEQDLQLLYDKGFYPVNASDVVKHHLDVPAGKSPVVLTFDDARKTQFNLIDGDKARQVDPNCAVGVMERFVKKHSDWKLRATFFVLPKSKVTNESFGQTGLGKDKIAYLLQAGMEVANHSTLHKSFRGYKAEEIQRELGGADQAILALNPEAKIETFAVPMGKFPSDKKLWPYLLKGTFNGKSYDYLAVFDAAWRPIVPPGHKKYNPLKLERINSVDGLNGVRYWVEKLAAPGADRYVSDGDPNWVSFPKSDEPLVNRQKLEALGLQINAYEQGAAAAKGIQSAADAPTPAAAPSPAVR